MKALLFACSFIAGSLFAGEVLLEGKAGYFFPQNHKFRKIYGSGLIYGAELSVQAWKWLYPWASASYFSKTGHSFDVSYSTRVTFVPVGVGLKGIYTTRNVDFYLGAGLLATYLHTHDHSCFVIQRQSKWGVGAIAKAGLLFNLRKHIFLDIFGDYSWTKIHFHNTRNGTVIPQTANLSGFSVGAGLGGRF